MSMDSSDYCIGYIEFQIEDAPSYVAMAEAANMLYAEGVVAVYGHARVTDDAVRFPVAVGGVRGQGIRRHYSAIEALTSVFGEKRVKLRALQPRLGNSRDTEATMRLAKLNPDNAHVTATDLAPLVKRGAMALDPFDGLVGLEKQRTLVREVANAVAVHGRDALESLHMVFTGPPGVGKTEVARRLLAFYDRTGVTNGRGRFVMADACDLMGEHVGETPRLVRNTVDSAMGGLLFIDEAYRLIDVDGKGYGHEAVDELVEKLESHRQDVICIMAGYPEKMECLFSMNPGLRDRFGFTVSFDAFSDNELAQIFRSMAEERGFTCTPGLTAELPGIIQEAKNARDFAYARTMRRLLDRTVIKQALHTNSKVLGEADLRAAGQEMLGQTAVKRQKIGFVS